MTGTLGLFSLLDVIQLLSSSSRTGCLNVKHPDDEVNFYFAGGKLVHATFGSLQGEKAVIALFKNEQGAFEFLVGTKAPKVSITQSTENLLLTSIRAAGENSKSTSTTQISDTAVPIFAADAPNAGNLTLYAQEISVLRFIDSHSSVGEIAKRVNLDVKEVKQVVARLMRIGALSLRTRKPRVARLITKLAKMSLPPNTVGIDKNIINKWQQASNSLPTHVACKQSNGKVNIFQIRATDNLGPFILMSQDTFFSSSLSANITLLVRPLDS